MPKMTTAALLATSVGLAISLAAAARHAEANPSHVEFVPASEPIHVGPMAGKPVLFDMDGDGDLDAVVACGPCCGRDPDPASGHVRVLFNEGDGTLLPPGPRVELLDSALGVAVGDIDEDGSPDAAVFHHNDYRVGILRGNSDGTLGEPEYLLLFDGDSAHVHSIVLADANNDGHLDILATLVDDHALAVLLGDGRGAFEPALGQPFFAHRHPYAQLNILDLNGDTFADALLTDLRGNGLTVLVGSGTGMYAPSRGFNLNAHTPITSAERPMAAAVADLDADGDMDAVAVIDESDIAVVMINTGNGEYVEHGTNPARLAVAATSIALGDVTGDGVPDLITGGTQTDSCSVAAGRGDGTFFRPAKLKTGGQSPSVALADMNGDGRLDIVTGNYDSGTVSVLLNRGE